MDVSTIPGLISCEPPATSEAISQLRAALRVDLPDEYIAFLFQADGLYANSFTLYSSKDVPERNDTYEVAIYAPGYITIGDDGGGRAIVLRCVRGTSPVYLVGHGAMTPEEMVEVAPSLSEWIRLGCPLG